MHGTRNRRFDADVVNNGLLMTFAAFRHNQLMEARSGRPGLLLVLQLLIGRAFLRELVGGRVNLVPPQIVTRDFCCCRRLAQDLKLRRSRRNAAEGRRLLCVCVGSGHSWH